MSPDRFIPACAGNRRLRATPSPPDTVHPRVCGEQSTSSITSCICAGSSPRVRGTVRSTRYSSTNARFIPACAGNRTSPAPMSTRRMVHPRVCGEQAQDIARDNLHRGSSPRVRGTVYTRLRERSRPRFIPACAGNSRDRTHPDRGTAVHPRVCGEQTDCHWTIQRQSGSSPRVRGTVSSRGWRVLGLRFSPACAGNSRTEVPLPQGGPVHPRVCGEQFRRHMRRAARAGSSPRVRGTVDIVGLITPVRRFIPACAGNRPQGARSRSPTSVHPRVCGEQVKLHRSPCLQDGSSPRVRGTELRPDRAERHERFIPACAGNRFEPPASADQNPVHPRVCGEQVVVEMSEWSSAGSSPRVRGTVFQCHRLILKIRFIPACAGNSSTPW